MYKKFSSIFWGLFLIAAGAITLAQNQGYIAPNQPFFWAGVFALSSAAALILYFQSGIRNWGMLFPAGIFGGLAAILTFAGLGVTNSGMAAPLFVGIAIPFVAAFLLDRENNWWALIPTGVMAFLVFVLLTVERLGGVVIGSALFFILAASFGAVYATRRVRWAAIVTYVMFVLGFMPLISMTPRPELAGIVVAFAIALPFFVVYFRSPSGNTWALIPAGIMGSAGLAAAFMLIPGIPGRGYDNHLANSIMLLGVAATFAVIWLRHHKPWAAVFTLLALVASAANMFRGNLQNYLPVLVVLAGFFLLYNGYRANHAELHN